MNSIIQYTKPVGVCLYIITFGITVLAQAQGISIGDSNTMHLKLENSHGISIARKTSVSTDQALFIKCSITRVTRFTGGESKSRNLVYILKIAPMEYRTWDDLKSKWGVNRCPSNDETVRSCEFNEKYFEYNASRKTNGDYFNVNETINRVSGKFEARDSQGGNSGSFSALESGSCESITNPEMDSRRF